MRTTRPRAIAVPVVPAAVFAALSLDSTSFGHFLLERIRQFAVGGEFAFTGGNDLEFALADIEDVLIAAAVLQQLAQRAAQHAGGAIGLQGGERFIEMAGGCSKTVAQRRQQFLAREVGGLGHQAKRQIAVGANVEHRLQGGKPHIGHLRHTLLLDLHGEVERGVVDQRRQGTRDRRMRRADMGVDRQARIAHGQAQLDGLRERGEVVGHFGGGAAQRRRRLGSTGNRGESVDRAGQVLLVGLERRQRRLPRLHITGADEGRRDRDDLGAALGETERLAHRRQVLAGDAVERASHILIGEDSDGAGEHGEPGDAAEGGEELAADAEAAPRQCRR